MEVPESDMQPHSTICACLIVKNEQDNLARCLSSIRSSVDHIVVVDTGSTDDTVAIAESFGAEVFHFEWRDDFAAARNESLSHARGDWVIWVDADDELMQGAPNALRQLCDVRPGPDWGYWLDVRSPYGEDGELEVAVRQWRLFRNNRGVHFRGRIHEEPWPPHTIQPYQIFAQDDIRIQHWGYVPQGDRMQHKSERNRRLLELSIKEDPGNPGHHYNLGRQHIREGNMQAAMESMQHALDLWFQSGQPPWLYAHSIFSFAALAAVQLGQYEKAIEIERRAPEHLLSAELLCSSGEAMWRLGRREEAIARLERACNDPLMIKAHLHDHLASTWHPLLMLSGLYDQTGRPELGYECASKAIDYAPNHPEILLALAYLGGKVNRPREERLSWLRRLLDGDRDFGFKAQARRLVLDMATTDNDPALALEAFSGEIAGVTEEQAIIVQAAAYERVGRPQEQYELLEKASKDRPQSVRVRLALADFLERHGYPTEALTALAQGLEQADAPAELYTRLAGLLAKCGRMDDAANALEIASKLTPAGGSSGVAAVAAAT